MKIKEFIDRHERVKVIWEALQKNSDEQFRKRVLGTVCLNISVMENTNIDRKTGKSGILYQIEMGTWGDGFFWGKEPSFRRKTVPSPRPPSSKKAIFMRSLGCI